MTTNHNENVQLVSGSPKYKVGDLCLFSRSKYPCIILKIESVSTLTKSNIIPKAINLLVIYLIKDMEIFDDVFESELEIFKRRLNIKWRNRK